MDSPAPAPLLMPEAPALVAGYRHAAFVGPGGVVETVPRDQAVRRLRHGPPPLVCHVKATARRLGIGPFAAFDLLTLFAFVRPGRFAVPTPGGLARAVGLDPPLGLEDQAAALPAIARALLAELAATDPSRTPVSSGVAPSVAWAMARGGWPWADVVLAALGIKGEVPHGHNLMNGLRVWQRLPEWAEHAPPPEGGHEPVSEDEARERLQALLGEGAEHRPQQADYTAAAAHAFAPRDRAGEPPIVLAEAGTGVGKTLGYIAPAGLWAEKNHAPVWISTYTRNLQRQLDAELDRLYPDPAEKARRVVVRKGRENYLCLLNFDEAVSRLAANPADATAIGLMARWALSSRDGDMVGGDFPGWLADLLGARLTLDMTDTRGECIHAACIHYGKCFIERSIRRARRARIVVANHALVMVQAAMGGDETALPTRYVFDEGHHVFEAADKAFSADLTGLEAADLRRWLRGAEEGARTRARGLRARLGELLTDPEDAEALDEILRAANALPGPGWHQRLAGGAPMGPAETFLALVRVQVHARSDARDGAYSLEAPAHPPVPGLQEAALALESALAALVRPANLLLKGLARKLDDEAAELDTATRNRIEASRRGLERRAVLTVQAWRAMLKSLTEETPPEFVDWLGIERRDGHDVDVGLHRQWVDPTRPFAEAVLAPSHGALITSATLTDDSHADLDTATLRDWLAADLRTGAVHMAAPTVRRVGIASPFDYARQTRLLVVGDVDRTSTDQVASAYRELFVAAGGGGLGLFTAISRLRAVHARIAAPLEEAGIGLLAQHVDALDTGTLVDIFRAEENTCLLGTDAVRDGVDVPGRALRLIVFDRVPWPRPTIVHRARRAAFEARDGNAGRRYDEMLTRFRLRQAFGRLIRRGDDRGVFVMLDRALPSRLLGAFPEGVRAERVGLAQAIAEVRGFIGG